MSYISLIYAVSSNGVIGNNNGLPWSIPDDLKMFSSTTKHSNVIMGRKTWESMKCKPLKNRTNFVVTSNDSYNADGAIVITDVHKFMHSYYEDTPLFVIGGAELYKQLQPYCSTAYVTRVYSDIPGDTKFDIDDSMWIIDNESEVMESNGYKYQFFKYVRCDNSGCESDELLARESILQYINGGIV